MQFSYLHFKHPNILPTSDELSGTNSTAKVHPKCIKCGVVWNANTIIAFLFSDALYVVTEPNKVAYQSWEVKLIAINLSSSLASWQTDKHLNDSLVRVVLPPILCCTVRTEPSVLVMYVLTPERSRHLYWVTQAGKLHEATGQPNTSVMKSCRIYLKRVRNKNKQELSLFVYL